MTGAAHIVTGTPRRCATSSTGSWASNTTAAHRPEVRRVEGVPQGVPAHRSRLRLNYYANRSSISGPSTPPGSATPPPDYFERPGREVRPNPATIARGTGPVEGNGAAGPDHDHAFRPGASRTATGPTYRLGGQRTRKTEPAASSTLCRCATHVGTSRFPPVTLIWQSWLPHSSNDYARGLLVAQENSWSIMGANPTVTGKDRCGN